MRVLVGAIVLCLLTAGIGCEGPKDKIPTVLPTQDITKATKGTRDAGSAAKKDRGSSE